MALFSGIVPRNDNSSNGKKLLHAINPPEKISTFIYHCGDRFLLEPLKRMVEPKETYGLITVGRKEATIGYIRGIQIEIIKEFTSGIHQKHKAGGQSSPRFQRITNEVEMQFYRRIASKMSEIFLPMKNLSGLFIGGSGHSKLGFIKQGKLNARLKSIILDVVDTSYDGGHEGMHALVHKIQEKITHVRFIREKKEIDEFLGKIARNPESVSYGTEETKVLIDRSLVRKVLISELHDEIDEIRNMCLLQGTTLIHISSETIEGKMLHDTFGGIVGFLR